MSTQRCGNRCGSEYRPQNRSGPAPVFAATEAFGCTSSYDSRVISTLTPVAWVKALMSATKASSSDCTKYFQRSIDSWAPDSGFHWFCCAQALAKSRRFVAPAKPSAAPPFSIDLRSIFIMPIPPKCRDSWFVVAAVPRRPCPYGLYEPLAGLLVEQVHDPGVGPDMDGLAGTCRDALAEDADHLLVAALDHDLGLGAHRLDHHDLDRHALRCGQEMLRADAVDRGLARGA